MTVVQKKYDINFRSGTLRFHLAVRPFFSVILNVQNGGAAKILQTYKVCRWKS